MQLKARIDLKTVHHITAHTDDALLAVDSAKIKHDLSEVSFNFWVEFYTMLKWRDTNGCWKKKPFNSLKPLRFALKTGQE